MVNRGGVFLHKCAKTSCVIMLAFWCSVFCSISVSAVSSTLTISIDDHITLNISPANTGVFSSTDTSSQTISITTDHFTGYTLGIKANNANGALVNTSDNTKTIPSITNATSAEDYASSSSLNNTYCYPIALITADELSFAGAGSQTANQGSAYSSSSFVRSGSNFWTMTPNSRTTSNSYATLMYYSNANGYLSNISMYNSYGIRPIISLKEGTEATAGTGTAEDPWVVEAP